MPSPVSPEVLRLVKAIELRTRGLVASLFTGDNRSVFRGHGIEFAEVRAYAPGDDYRSIDWNVAARMGHPYVKTFVEERERTLLLVVDRSASAEVGPGRTRAELATEVAAVLALAASRTSDRVGALVFTDRVEHVVPPAKGRPHALRIIRDLAAFRPAARGTDLARALAYAARLLRRRSVVVILSDFLAAGWTDALGRLALRHDVVAVSLDDPLEVELPEVGWIELVDAESGARGLVNTGDHLLRRRYAGLVARRLAERAQCLAAAGADHIALVTDRPYAPSLRRAFHRRAQRPAG
jgi:uncharacterized protein (DUF58 family)